MSILWKKIGFYEGKSVCKAIVFEALGPGESPGGLSGGQRPKLFWFFNVFKAFKWTVELKKLYS